MPIRTLLVCLAGGAMLGLLMPVLASPPALAQERQPWTDGDARPGTPDNGGGSYGASPDRYGRSPGSDAYPSRGSTTTTQGYGSGSQGYGTAPQGYGSAPQSYGSAPPSRDDAYHPPGNGGPSGPQYDPPRPDDRYASQNSYSQPYSSPGQYGAPYDRDNGRGGGPYGEPYGSPPPQRREYEDGTFSMREIRDAGHGFFGTISQGLASVIEYAFQRQGRPNGYILGEDVGGAFIAGLRYGEGWLTTRDAGRHKVFWQGPSLGYDAGAEGSKVMVLVYNLRDPQDIYHRFGGVDGSAYIVGGVGVMFQTNDDMVLAPIRAGIGLRLGANVGYLKYTRTPTWNPF